jgi:DNA-binding NtrC family response regulator
MSGKRLDVLLVDDDEDVLLATAALISQNHEVRAVSGLREAMYALVARVPDAIVCDLDLDPFRGDALLALIAREHPEVRRVLYTGSRRAVGGSSFDDVAHRVLLKPASLSELLAAITGDSAV